MNPKASFRPNRVITTHNHQTSRAPRGTSVFSFPVLQLGLLALLSLMTQPTPAHAAWIWIVALFWMGMPHGGLDLHVLTWTHGGPFHPRAWGRFGIYFAIMVAAAGFFWIAPLCATISFLILTAVHFGEADRIFARDCLDPKAFIPRSWGLFRGALVVSLPCWIDPAGSWEPFALMAGGLTSDGYTSALHVFGILMFSICAITACWSTVVQTVSWRSPATIGFLIETGFVAAWFVLLPPLWAIGGYFLAMHATKHMIRLAWLDEQWRGRTRWVQGVLRLHLDALWLSAPAWLMVAALALLVPAGPVLALAVASIGFYLTCTLPHHLLVERLPGA
ncbi:MAG: hypothetical protein CMJ39_02270 [Phycisphaerae bacterium]|nr:hypothetical protein [Phycisphaerae bacterium]